jgi:hypothetical protein
MSTSHDGNGYITEIGKCSELGHFLLESWHASTPLIQNPVCRRSPFFTALVRASYKLYRKSGLREGEISC